jgi:hypothetical protein
MKRQKDIWTGKIAELETFFASTVLPSTLALEPRAKVTNMKLFVESHISICRGQNGNQRYLPYLERLQRAMEILRPAIADTALNNDL